MFARTGPKQPRCTKTLYESPEDTDKMSSDRLHENLCYLSAVSKFNTERRTIVRKCLDQLLRSGQLLDEEVSIEQLQECGSQKEQIAKDHSGGFDYSFEELILSVPDDVRPHDFQKYLLFRYHHVEEQLESKG